MGFESRVDLATTVGPFQMFRPSVADLVDANTYDGGASAWSNPVTPRVLAGVAGVGYQATDDGVLSVEGMLYTEQAANGEDGYWGLRFGFYRQGLAPATTTNGQACYASFTASGGAADPDISTDKHAGAGLAYIVDNAFGVVLNSGQGATWGAFAGAANLNPLSANEITVVFERVGTNLHIYCFRGDSVAPYHITYGAAHNAMGGRAFVGVQTRHAAVGSAGVANLVGYRKWTAAPWGLA